MQIVSGASKRGVARRGFAFVLLAGFAGWFAYDGWVTYPNRNVETARQALPRVVGRMPPASPAVTEESAAAVQAGVAKGIRLADLRQKWGEPAFTGPLPADAGGASKTEAYFVGPYGWVRVILAAEMVDKIEWHAAAKSPSEIWIQKGLGIGLAAVALVPLGLLLTMQLGKYQLDDEGLVLPRVGRIPYERMTGVDASDFSKKGIVLLRYHDGTGADRTAVLDEEQIDKFDEIVVALCKRKGWPVDADPAEPTDAPKAE